MGVELEGTQLQVTKHMSKEPPRRIVQVDVEVFFKIAGLGEKEKQIFENTGKTCPVARSLHPDIVQHIQYHWPD